MIQKRFAFLPLTRMTFGLGFAIASFVVSATLNYAVERNFFQHAIPIVSTVASTSGHDYYDTTKCLNANYQFFQYVLLSMGEVLFVISGLEFAYTQVSDRFKSVSVAVWLMAAAVGNGAVVLIEGILELCASGTGEDGNPRQLLDVSGKMFLYAGIAFVFWIYLYFWSRRYEYKVEGRANAKDRPVIDF